jgi:hypothetical protein
LEAEGFSSVSNGLVDDDLVAPLSAICHDPC